jgi:hypothetical protein
MEFKETGDTPDIIILRTASRYGNGITFLVISTIHQCCGSGFIGSGFGSGSSISRNFKK